MRNMTFNTSKSTVHLHSVILHRTPISPWLVRCTDISLLPRLAENGLLDVSYVGDIFYLVLAEFTLFYHSVLLAITIYG